jgi:hypothetical protein
VSNFLPDHESPIEQYLDELYERLTGPAHRARRVLAEAEAHLRDFADARIAEGVESFDAEQQAVAAFGPVQGFAASCNRISRRERTMAFVRELRTPAILLVGVGFLTIGVSGLLDRLLVSAFGSQFVFGDPPGTTYAASDCKYWLSIHPHAGSCTKAYLAEAVADGVSQRLVIGLVGIVVMGALFWWSGRRGRPVGRASTMTTTVMAAVFGTAGVLLIGYGVDRAAVFGAYGPGQFVSDGAVSLFVAVLALIALVRSWRPRHEGVSASD